MGKSGHGAGGAGTLMAMAFEGDDDAGAARSEGQWLRDNARRYLPHAVILVAALALRYTIGAVSDVSWQITLCEKILDGQRLYVDLLEVNPPASTFLYLPAVALARLLHLSPGMLIDLQALVAACLSVLVAGRILSRSPAAEGLDLRAAGIVTLAVLTLLPLHTFAQREHFALIAVLPVLAAAASRAAGVAPLAWQAVIAGLCAGVTVCIKPHFALAVLFAFAVAAAAARSIRPIVALENWIGAATVLLYAAVVALFYPAFLTDMMPLLADLYLPARLSLTNVLIVTPVLLCAAAFAVLVALDRNVWRTVPFQVLGAASLGFAIAYLVQGKGWPYQALPMLAPTAIAFEIALHPGRESRARATAAKGTIGLACVILFSVFWLQIGRDTGPLTAEVRRIAQKPSVVVISGDIALGHPLVREAGGRWISAVCSLWIMNNARLLEKAGLIPQDAKARIADHVARDRQRLIADIRFSKPDIILVQESDPAWTEWASSDPQVKARLADYTKRSTVDGVAIYKRNGP